MRRMTPGEYFVFYNQRRMPCGCGNEYLPGPCGGCSMNIKCPTCGLRLNVIDPQTPMRFRPGEGMGEVIEEPEGYVPPPDPKPKTGWWAGFVQWWRMT